MKNLKLCLEFTVDLDLQSKDEFLLFFATDFEQNRLFFASSSNIIYIVHMPSSQERNWSKDLLAVADEHMAPTLDPGDSLTALGYLMEKEALILGTSNGYLLLHSSDSNITEIVGKVESGVKSISLSPDGGLLAVATGFGQLLVMTHDWEVLYESTLEPPEICDNMVSDTSSTITGSYLSEGTISWRGDGKYFATLTRADESNSLRQLWIWEQDSGALHASSESKAFSGAALDWMPSGAKVASVYDRKAEKKCPSIVFFEKNGLERSSFSIDAPVEATVEMLKWNCNSELLAAVVRCEGHDAIKVWSFSNNHWYLKQEIRYPSKDKVRISWDPVKHLRLICWTMSAKITTYDFIWITAVTENSISFVIDNTNILVSPLALSLMPPPMSLFKLKFPSSVQEVAFFCKNSKTHLVASLSDGNLSIVELPAIDAWESLEGEELSIETCRSDTNFGNLRHLIWLDSHLLLGILYCEPSHTDFCSALPFRENGCFHQGKKQAYRYSLQEIELECSEDSIPDLLTSTGWQAKVSKRLFSEWPIIAVSPNPARKCSAFVQFDGGSVVEYSSKLGLSMPLPAPYLQKLDQHVGFSSSCPWLNVVPVCDNGLLKPLIFGLDGSGRLHVGRRILCNNCTSFTFYSNVAGLWQQAVTHLILTTKQDLLFIISIDDVLHENPEVKSENCAGGGMKNSGEDNRIAFKVWERGAKLIGVIHGDEAAVILQTVRGNLECIYPRKLVLGSIVDALVNGRFKDAMAMVRRHRIDFNVIVDHCGWQAFLLSASEFVRQVNNLTHITEFVCSIKNENVMEMLYRNVIASPCPKDPRVVHIGGFEEFEGKNKVSSVLTVIRKALEEYVPESPARELCILTTLVRSTPPALEEALKRIKDIRETELSRISEGKSYPSAEEALKHLLWLSDPEAVYEAALGLYDLNLAAIVALNSQRDPKEFLPFLQALEHMSPSVMKYKIDLKLSRFESALKHIATAGEAYYDDCLNLMKSNPCLFPLGLQLFTGSVKRNEILEAWGDHLNGEKCFEDAATTYLCCHSLQKALRSYRACGHWKGVLTVAGLLKLGKGEVLQLATELCEELHALGKPAQAARIALEYCGDVHGGIGYLVTAREWEEALRVCFMHGRADLVAEVETAAIECANTLVLEYEEGLEKIGKYLARYLAVRQRRLVLAAKLQMEDRSIIDEDADNASETSSSFSGMSAYTLGKGKASSVSINSSVSSKTREPRRNRNRGGKIRAGSPGEEIALVEHLRGMSPTSSAEWELKSLILALVMLGHEETARKLQRVGDSFRLSQCAAVKLAEDRMNSDSLDESSHSLENYIVKLRREVPHSQPLLAV